MGPLESGLHLGGKDIGLLLSENAMEGNPIGRDELDGGKSLDVIIFTDLRGFTRFDLHTDELFRQFDDLVIAKGALQHLLAIDAFRGTEEHQEWLSGSPGYFESFRKGVYKLNVLCRLDGGSAFRARRGEQSQLGV